MVAYLLTILFIVSPGGESMEVGTLAEFKAVNNLAMCQEVARQNNRVRVPLAVFDDGSYLEAYQVCKGEI